MKVFKIDSYRKKDVRSVLRIHLKTYLSWAEKALVKLWENGQTDKEKRENYAYEYNRRGFNRFDSPKAGRLYHRIQTGRGLTEQQKDMLLHMMPKYTDQLYNMSDPGKLKHLCDKFFREGMTT
jgi:hypothetical protein